MALKFGTSGLRGLVTDFTDDVVAGWVAGFLDACPGAGPVFVGRDLRASSPGIAAQVMATAEAAGCDTIDCGALPTPALALAAQGRGRAIMVTGSHIPADRNGLKFYTMAGEVTKPDEVAIAAAQDAGGHARSTTPGTRATEDATAPYLARYVEAFGPHALAGLRVGLYEHSAVGRDVLGAILETLGAELVRLGRSDDFVPVDTEAVDPATRAQLADWCKTHKLDALASTDGDSDRPMLTDATGRVVPGDILGVLTARALGAKTIATPISTNSLVSRLDSFDRVLLTKIGSPYVLAAMAEAQTPEAKVVGFEPNGGFLLGFTASGPTGPLPPLMTRDAALPIVAALADATAQGQTLADLCAALPARFTAADRLQKIDRPRAAALLARLDTDASPLDLPDPLAVDRTDGLRLTLPGDDILHLRVSGNAPEFRVYTEAATQARAEALLAHALDRLARALA